MTLINFYKLITHDESLIYIGSTKKELIVRMAEHILSWSNAKFKSKNKSYSEFNQLSKESWNQYQKNFYWNTNYKDYKKDYYKTNKIKLKNKYIIRKLFRQLPSNIL